MQTLNRQEDIIRKRRAGKLGRFFSFLINNWIVILILILFISQMYLIWEIREMKKINNQSNISAAGKVSETDINQIKSMISSMFSRIGTMQGDLNYLKNRR